MPPVPVVDAAVEHAPEQRRPFLGRALAVTADEAEHRLLHEVERVLALARGEFGHAPGATLDAAQEGFQRTRGVTGGRGVAGEFETGHRAEGGSHARKNRGGLDRCNARPRQRLTRPPGSPAARRVKGLYTTKAR